MIISFNGVCMRITYRGEYRDVFHLISTLTAGDNFFLELAPPDILFSPDPEGKPAGPFYQPGNPRSLGLRLEVCVQRHGKTTG